MIGACKAIATTHGRRLARRSSCCAWLLLLLAGTAAAQVTDSGEYLKRMDGNGDGRVSLDEYLAWMSYAFDQRDRNGDGVLSADELPGGRGKPVTRAAHIATLTERFRKQDANGDGSLSAKELLAPPR
ncbi:MAG TPA: calcium-dependent protein kinase 21 [Stenotrophomonas sp.]|nr:calcium-dependent protein kinase 21 [Stenotrophomonas sp.]